MESTSFTPSLAQDLRENAVISLGLLVLVPVVVYFMRCGISLQYAVICGIAGAAPGVHLLYMPVLVFCSEESAVFRFRAQA